MIDIVAEAGRLERWSSWLVEEATTPVGRRRHPVSVQRASANPKLSPVRRVMVRQRRGSARPRFDPTGPLRDQHLRLDRRDLPGLVPLQGRRLLCQGGGEPPDELVEAGQRWRDRGGGAVWTYTHRHREIPRSAWGSIAVMASVEDGSEVRWALSRGYGIAITVQAFPRGPKAFTIHGAVIPRRAGKPVYSAGCAWTGRWREVRLESHSRSTTPTPKRPTRSYQCSTCSACYGCK